MIDIQEKSSTFKWVCISLFILVILFYAQSYNLRLDAKDHTNNVFCEDYPNVSILYTQFAWTNQYGVHPKDSVRPLRNLCFLLAYDTAGHQNFHIVLRALSCIAHLVSSICIFILIKRITANTLVGMSSAMLFGGSYIHAETILECVCLNDIMLCMFGLLSIIFYIRYFDGKGAYNYASSLTFLLLACLSKENGIAVFPLIFLVDIYLRKESVEKGGPWRNGFCMRGIRTCLPFLLLSILYGLFLVFYCEFSGATYGSIETVTEHTWLWLVGTFFRIYRETFNLTIGLTPNESIGTKYVTTLLIVAIYVVSDRGLRRLIQLLLLCSFILIFPIVLYGILAGWSYVYLPLVFVMGLFACVMNQGAEKLCGVQSFHSAVQPFFTEIPKRRLVVAIVVCWLAIHFDQVQYTHDAYVIPIHGYALGILKPLVNHSVIYGYLLPLIMLFTLLGLVFIYARTSKEVKDFIHLAGLCTLILAYPIFSHSFHVELLYLIAALSMAPLVCAAGYVIEKFLNPRRVDFKNPHAIAITLLLLIHMVIICNNYDFIEGKIRGKITHQKWVDWLAKPINGVILEKEGYREKTVYLLNFPPIESFCDILRLKPPVKKLGGYRRMFAYACGLDLNALDDMNTLPEMPVQNTLVLDTAIHYGHPRISAEEFNDLAKDPNNKMLLLDDVTEQILDISGMNFNNVKDIMANKEKQKAFILP